MKKELKKEFSVLEGAKLKMAPKGFPKDFKDINLLKNKHFTVLKKIENELWFKENSVKLILKSFETQQDFNHFLNRALEAEIVS